jgi:hypothetical protein
MDRYSRVYYYIVFTNLGVDMSEITPLEDLTDEELFAKVAYHYRDYPLVMELLSRARNVDYQLWVARVGAACAVKSGY